MNKYAVIVAGGSGIRMGMAIPKQFLLLHGRTILYHSVKSFLDAYEDLEVILVLPEQYLEKDIDLPDPGFAKQRIKITCGGETRFQSVKNGLDLVKVHSIVFVHDAVRCLVSKNLIHRCYEQALEKGSAIPAVTATDSIRIEKNGSHHVVDRTHIRIVQTPQAFESAVLLRAFDQPYQPGFTDEATVVEANGTRIFLIEGEHNNIKITRPVDLLVAEKTLEDTRLFEQS